MEAATASSAEVKRWNWGAFLLTWIWGIGNQVWIALLALVPIVGFVMMFVLRAKGNEWAWNNGPYADVESFRRRERRWAIAGIVLYGLVYGLVAAGAIAGAAGA